MLALILSTLLTTNFPLNQELESEFSANGYGIKLTYKVVKSEDKYTYFYSIKNTSKVPCKFKCNGIQSAMNIGWEGGDMVYDLAPNEHINFVLLHSSPPKRYITNATIYVLATKEEFIHEWNNLPDKPKDVQIVVPNKSYYKGCNGSLLMVLPTSMKIFK